MSREKEIMQKKLNEMLSRKAQSIGQQVASISETGSLIDDYVVNVNQMDFDNVYSGKGDDRGHIEILFPDHKGQYVNSLIHDHAYDHMGSKFGVPVGYLKTLAHGQDWQRGVATQTLQDFAANVPRDKMLLRAVPGRDGMPEVRAALSDRYKRLNSMKLFLTFLTAAQQAGATLIDANNGDTRSFMEVVHPEVIEFDTELNGKNYAVFGTRMQNSDFGRGALQVGAYMKFVTCWNGLTGESIMREVHMGGVIPNNITISDRTVLKDTEAKASLIQDAMNSIYTGDYKDAMIQTIKGASAKEVDIKKETEKLPKLGLSKQEVEAFTTLMMNNNPSDNLSGAPTMWKFVNGLTALARDSEPDRGRDLEKIAGEMLGV